MLIKVMPSGRFMMYELLSCYLEKIALGLERRDPHGNADETSALIGFAPVGSRIRRDNGADHGSAASKLRRAFHGTT